MKAIILVAGKNSRFWPLGSTKQKCMYEIMGKPLLEHTLLDLKRAGIRDIVIVIGHNDHSITAFCKTGKQWGLRIEYAVQKKQEGMGDALLAAQKHLTEPFFVLHGHKVNAGQCYTKMARRKEEIVLGIRSTKTPSLYGVIEYSKKNTFGRIVEKPQGVAPSNHKVEGVYILPPDFLKILKKVAGHYSFEEAINGYAKEGVTVGTVLFDDIDEVTLKYPWHLLALHRSLLSKFCRPSISKTAKIAKSATLIGAVMIQDGVIVDEHATIVGPSFLDKGAYVGTCALVRDHTSVGKNSVVGSHTELKNTILYDDVKTHMNYLGDSIIDSHSRLGAGTITANRRLDRATITTSVGGKKVDSGFTFFGCITGENVMTGIQVGLMPGIKLGNKSNVGPGTVVTLDVSDNTTLYVKQSMVTKKQ